MDFTPTEKDKVPAAASTTTATVTSEGMVFSHAAPQKTALLECSVCHNTDTVEGVLGRQHYPGSCGHCGSAFRVIEK
jgi:hypothetical protein